MRLEKNEQLAELIGMALGDGNLGKYPRCQYLRIYCNINEEQYASRIENILEKIFKKKPYRYYRPKESILYLEISKKDLDKILGIPIGDKIKNGVKIPGWIFKNHKYLIACLRGLFDTDGCCYLTGKKYRIINFRTACKSLEDNILKALKALKYHPYLRQKAVELGRQSEVERFFEEIKPGNLKHYRHDLPR